MNYLPMLDEENGFCPQCASADTVSLRAKAKRVCLNCEFSEEFESYTISVLAWQKRKDRGQRKLVLPAGRNPETSPEVTPPSRPAKEIEKVIESIEPNVTKVTIPTQYREDFTRYLALRKVELSRPIQTDKWNGVESSYTDFEICVKFPVANAIFEDWLVD